MKIPQKTRYNKDNQILPAAGFLFREIVIMIIDIKKPALCCKQPDF